MEKANKKRLITGYEQNNIYNVDMNITRKLFLSLLGLTAIILLVTLLLARWSFEKGFFDFISELENQRLSRISEQVLEVYQSNQGDWSRVSQRELEYLLDIRPAPRDFGPRGPRGRPPPERRGQGPMSFEQIPPHRRVPEEEISTAIYDVNGELLVGSNLSALVENQGISNERKVEFDKKHIATIKSWNAHKFGSSVGSQFSQQQLYTSLWIGLACFVIAVVLSAYWSKALLAPIKEVIAGINRLSTGKYEIPIEHTRKDEFGKLMNDLNHLAATLDKTRTARNRWFADISHELRTPLSVLMGEIEALKLGIRPFNIEQIQSLEQETLVLNRLIDDLYQLSISDIGALRYEFSSFSLSELIEHQCAAMQVKAQAINIEISCQLESDIEIYGDESRFAQLVSNLLMNSIKYTDSSGAIQINLSRKENLVTLVIDDSKPGVDSENIAHLFEPLYRQEQSRNRSSGGAGLGLAICKNIVEAHQGRIQASHSHLGGLCVRVEFDLSKLK